MPTSRTSTPERRCHASSSDGGGGIGGAALIDFNRPRSDPQASSVTNNLAMAVPPSTVRTTARPSAPRQLSRRPTGLALETSAGTNPVPRRVAFLVYDGVTLLDVAGPAEVFEAANRFGADYRIVLLSPTGEDITS